MAFYREKTHPFQLGPKVLCKICQQNIYFLTLTIFKNGQEMGVDLENTIALVVRVFLSETDPSSELSLK